MSIDLSVVEQFKDTHLSYLIRQLNGRDIANITLGQDGYINNNRAFVKLKTQNVNLDVVEAENAYKMKMTDLYLYIRSQLFKYNLWFVPIKATLDVEVGNVGLDFKV